MTETRTTNEIVQANYSKLSDHIRRLTPQGIQCSVFCGGTNCKYENPDNWKADSLALQGIYSHWITDDIIAMARPSTKIIIQKNLIQQFDSLGIKSIINLQSPREHASCGQPLEESGFSYDPSIFMENNIYYYNFAWKDYGDATLVGLLNMVKVLAFAITEGRVAIHCHAGLGRTGVLIACYLVYSLRVSANDAIRYVRLKRPDSVQTRGQLLCVRHFAQFVLPRTITYCLKENINREKNVADFTLQRFLKRQQVILHGYDERNFKYLPKVVHCICERILKLCGCWINQFPPSNTPFTTDFLFTKINGKKLYKYESMFSPGELTSPSNETSSMISQNPSENGDPSDSFSELNISDDDELNEELLTENRCFQELETQKILSQSLLDESIEIQDLTIVLDAFRLDYEHLSLEVKKQIRDYQIMLNTTQAGWSKLNIESNIAVLSILLFDWIESLKQPLIKRENFEHIVILFKQPELCFQKFSAEDAYLLEYLLRFISKINPLNRDDQDILLKRMLAACSQQTVKVGGKLLPTGKGLKKLREGTLTCALQFLQSLCDLIEIHHSFTPTYLEDSKIFSDHNFQ